MSAIRLELKIQGLPATKGSSVPYRDQRTGAIRVKADNRRLRAWERSIADRAFLERHLRKRREPLEGPVVVELLFRLPRPKGHYVNRDGIRLREGAPTLHAQIPDLDKLIRAVLDGLTKGQVWRDDGQVAELRARKVWTDQGDEGVQIVVTTEGAT